MVSVNRISSKNQVQKSNKTNTEATGATGGLKDRVSNLSAGIKAERASAGQEISLLSDPRMLEQAGLSQIAAVMANLGKGPSALAQGVIAKAQEEKQVEASFAA